MNIYGKLTSLLLAAVIVFPVCADEKSEIPRQVKTIIVSQYGDVTDRSYPGKVRANHRVDLAFNVSGVLESLDAREGNTIQKGDVVAQVDGRDINNNLQAAQAKLTELKLNYKRTKSLFKQKVIPEAKLDEIIAALDAAEANMRILKKRLDDTKLAAPFSGVVSKRYVENYAHIVAKQPIMSLQDISTIEVVVQVPESIMVNDVQAIFSDSKVIFDALPNKKFTVNVYEFSTQADPFTQTFSVVLSMSNPEGINILPGMTATVFTELKDDADVNTGVFVPVSAVFADEYGKSYVWIVTDEMKVIKAEVILGQMTSNNLVIKSGLNIDTRIVVAGVHFLKEGMAVRLMPAGEK